jgi:hypothetical protein
VSCLANREDHDELEAAADSEEGPEDVAKVASASYKCEEKISRWGTTSNLLAEF